jgi:predicted enzyme related to lactoylglutathione lyase
MDQRAGTWREGAIVWREAATTDLERTTAFYSELFGWTHHDSPMGEMGVYRHFEVDGQPIGAAYQMGKNMAGIPPHWIQYLSVADVDQAAEKVTANGGKINMGPMDIPHVGRVVYVQDPQGAAIALFRDEKGDAAPPDGRPGPGTFCWESLVTTDKKAAADFYTRVTSLKVEDFQGMPALSRGTGMSDGVADIGDAPPGVPPHWMSHVVVKNLEESRDRAARLGGQVMMPEIVVPTVGRIAIIADPVGAIISLFEPAPA